MNRLVILSTLLALVSGCTSGASNGTDVPASSLAVFAAASLQSSFTELGTAFEAANPGSEVRFTFDGSATLLDQLAAGAPADLLATADAPTMEEAISRGLAAPEATTFATNSLTLIVPPGNPAGVTGLDDSLDGAKVVVCQPRVPCGATTAKLAELLQVRLQPVSEESSVTGVRTKVEIGQADAGIVYLTDAQAAAGKVEQIPIGGAEKVRNEYLIASVRGAADPELARQFADFVTGPQGQRVLAAAGFGSPE